MERDIRVPVMLDVVELKLLWEALPIPADEYQEYSVESGGLLDGGQELVLA